MSDSAKTSLAWRCTWELGVPRIGNIQITFASSVPWSSRAEWQLSYSNAGGGSIIGCIGKESAAAVSRYRVYRDQEAVEPGRGLGRGRGEGGGGA